MKAVFEFKDTELDPEDVAEYDTLFKEHSLNKTQISSNNGISKEALVNKSNESKNGRILGDEFINKSNDSESEFLNEVNAKEFKMTEDSSNISLNVIEAPKKADIIDDNEEKSIKQKKKINKDLNLKSNIQRIIKVGSEQVEIDLEKLDNTGEIIFYSIQSINLNFQIKLDIKTKSPIDFGQCAISYNYFESEICIKSYLQIIKSDFILKVNKALLPNNLNIFVSLVISGCDSETRIRDIDFDGDKTHFIYHNSDHDCIYRVKKTFTLSMLSMKITKFPSKYEKVCKALVQVYTSKSKTDTEGELQASFEDHNTVNAFNQGLFITHQFAMIKVVNCYENNEPIEIKIDLIKSKKLFIKKIFII